MLDVHPPHAAAHSWRDFLIHIATISVGLLIAIGLEQIVEWVHHRHQLRETRQQLALELAENRDLLHSDLELTDKADAELDHNLQILRQHQASPAPQSGVLDYSWFLHRFRDAAWQAAKQNGSLNLMPYEELKADAFVYTVFANALEASSGFSSAIDVAAALAAGRPLKDLSPHDTEELISMTAAARGNLAFTRFLLQVTARRLPQAGAAR